MGIDATNKTRFESDIEAALLSNRNPFLNMLKNWRRGLGDAENGIYPQKGNVSIVKESQVIAGQTEKASVKHGSLFCL